MSVDFKVQIRALDAGDTASARPEMRRVTASGQEDLRAFVSTEFAAGAPVEMLVEYVDRDGDMIKMGPAAAEWDAMLADRAAGGSRVLVVSWKPAVAKSLAGAGAAPPPRPPASRLAPRAVVAAAPAVRGDDDDDDTPADEPAADYTCTLCNEVYDDPCKLSCGHTFCRGCLAKVVNDECPLCRTPFERAAALQARCRDPAILHYCRTVRVRCSGPGCTWSGENAQAKRHAATCVFVLAALSPAQPAAVTPAQVVKALASHAPAPTVRPPPPAYAAAAASATASRGVRDIVSRDDFDEAHHALPPPPPRITPQAASPPAFVVARPAAAASAAPAAAADTASGRDDATYRFSAEWGRALDAVQSHHIRASVYPKRVQILSTDFDGIATFALATPLTVAASGRKAFRVRIDRWHSPKSFAWIGLLPTDAKPRDKAKISQLGGCGISVCPGRHMQYEGAWWYNQPAGDALHLHVSEKSEVQVTADLAYGEATVEVFLPTDLETPARRLRMALRAPLVGADAVLPAVSLLCRGDVVDLVDASG